jgi:biopolymer transport protein ExbB
MMIDLLIRGGVLMIPLGLCSIIALAIIIERGFTLRRSHVLPGGFISDVQKMLFGGQVEGALALCKKADKPIAWVLEAGLDSYLKGKEKDEIEEAIETEASLHVIPRLERYLTGLATISQISTLLGLLGTVVGIIGAFDKIAVVGVGDMGALSGDIAVALITTAAGLVIAIPATVAHNYFTGKANSIIIEMEQISTDLVYLLTASGKKRYHEIQEASGKTSRR